MFIAFDHPTLLHKMQEDNAKVALKEQRYIG